MVMPRIRNQNNSRTKKQVAVQENREQRARKLIRQEKIAPGSYLARVRSVVDERTGIAYHSKKAMLAAQKNRNAQILREFAALVAADTLGQDPWERLPTESDLQFDRFRTFLNMKGRTLGAICRLTGVSQSVMQAAATKFHWKLRAQCWDKEVDRLADAEFKADKIASIRRQAKLGSRLQELASVGVDNMIAIRGADLTAADVARLADVGVKIERLAHDKSTSNIAEKTETRLVWEGPAPAWASHSQEVIAEHQTEPGPLTRKVNEPREASPEFRAAVRNLTVRPEEAPDA